MADGAIHPVRKENRGCNMPLYLFMPLEQVYSADSLFNAFMVAKQGTEWKATVQKYESNLLLNILETKRQIVEGTYKPKPMYEFTLCERGHIRQIKAQHIFDRVVQRSLNDNVLIPKIRPYLIYDNGASLKGKGLSFARKRFEIHLRNAYREYGENAYILFMDFKKYYDNIRHDVALKQFGQHLSADEFEFLKITFNEFEIDVSYMTEEEYQNSMSSIFNALEYSKIPSNLKTGERFLKKSVGIGNQSSQITGVYYPNSIDTYCKTVKGIRYYGRYMDDTYIIMRSKAELKALLSELKTKFQDIGIFVNMEKTHIYRITSWLPWLKINYKVKPTGGLIRKVHSKTFARERRKLISFYKLLMDGRITLAKVKQCYKSWRGTYKKYDSKTKLFKLDKYFKKIFKEDYKNG
ncbi:reverse transcriptase domain-containing protein [Anaerovibrio sp. RM50]|uniref:reverse transcriptase domain-containing protein n=1 Tax=Anaerovibrio sp. RM50 TaxID=1200557 RepID=UPI000685F66C|nr:reverse transcriptase domain-containing protein [Anaerovibrio sp. RM50]